MTEQHTPGPWTWPEGCTQIEALADPENSQTYYAPVAHMDVEWSAEAMAANARLIAAAPELLEALELIDSHLTRCINFSGVNPELRERLEQQQHNARAAIAKVTGDEA